MWETYITLQKEKILVSGETVFTDWKTDKLIVKFMWKYKGPRITRTSLKKSKFGGLTPLDYKMYS